jgi:membrane protein DedA with SNARE-associated domain
MEEFIQQTFQNLAYQPLAVYGAICLFMTLSSFGLPLPEEVVLLSAGFLAHFALFPDKPHPEGASLVNIHALAIISLIAVMGSDYLIYYLGRRTGPSIFESRLFRRMISRTRLEKAKTWVQKYGAWPVIVFRFTPGVRFPGHLMCGAMGLSPWKFIAVDFVAAGLSVPTQIYFVGYYGRDILRYIQQAKYYLFAGLVVFAGIYFFRKWRERKRQPSVPTS